MKHLDELEVMCDRCHQIHHGLIKPSTKPKRKKKHGFKKSKCMYYLRFAESIGSWWQRKLWKAGWEWSKELRCYYATYEPNIDYNDSFIAWAWKALAKYEGELAKHPGFQNLVKNRLSKTNKRRSAVVSTRKSKKAESITVANRL